MCAREWISFIRLFGRTLQTFPNWNKGNKGAGKYLDNQKMTGTGIQTAEEKKNREGKGGKYFEK